MPDIDDMPDPIDEAYRRAEAALDDEAARAARRARVLAAVAETPAAIPPASARRPFRRPAGWLAAAGVAGFSVWTAVHVYKTPARQLPAAPTPTPAASSMEPPAIGPSRRPAAKPRLAPAPPPVRPSAPSPETETQARSVAPPPPLPIPPVERPIAPRAPIAAAPDVAPPPPLAIPPVRNAIAQPPPPPPPPPVAVAPPGQGTQTVVVTGARMARKEYTAPSPAIAPPPPPPAPLGPPVSPDGPAKLRAAAAAGRADEILDLLNDGVPVDAPDADGETALMRSIEADKPLAAALLRRRGAGLDRTNRAGVSARDMAVKADDAELGRALGLSP